MNNTISLVEENGILSLERNEQRLNCPFKMQAPMQTPEGVGFVSQTCDSLCPLFRYDEKQSNDSGETKYFTVQLCKGDSFQSQLTERKISIVKNKIVH